MRNWFQLWLSGISHFWNLHNLSFQIATLVHHIFGAIFLNISKQPCKDHRQCNFESNCGKISKLKILKIWTLGTKPSICRTFNTSQDVLKLFIMIFGTYLSMFQHVAVNFYQLVWCDFSNHISNVSFQFDNCMRIVTIDFTLLSKNLQFTLQVRIADRQIGRPGRP